jgi:hypothetical protein
MEFGRVLVRAQSWVIHGQHRSRLESESEIS